MVLLLKYIQIHSSLHKLSSPLQQYVNQHIVPKINESKNEIHQCK